MLPVPGISIVFGECVSCHARPTCDTVTPRRKATPRTRCWSMTLGSVPKPPPRGKYVIQAMPFLTQI